MAGSTLVTMNKKKEMYRNDPMFSDEQCRPRSDWSVSTLFAIPSASFGTLNDTTITIMFLSFRTDGHSKDTLFAIASASSGPINL